MAKNNKSSDKAPQVALPKKFTLYYVLIFVLAFIYYGNGIKNGYSLDDNLITSTYNSKHPTIEGGLAAIPEIFTTHFVVNSKQSYAYRPVATSSFAIEYQFFGTNPHVSHFFNILIYALEILVLFKLLNRLWGEDKYILTVLVSFLFLIHPIHSEVVNNIKCRDELLSFLFGMLAMYHAINYIDRQNKKYLIYISLFMLMSILSKPTGLIFIAVIPFTTYFFREITFKRILPIIGFIVIGYAFFKGFEKLLVDATVNRVKYYFENPLYYMGFAPRIPMFFYTNFYYIALLVFPYPLRYYYGYDQVPLADWSNPIVYLMILTTALGLYFMIKRFKNKDIWAYGIWFYLLGIGGALNLLSPMVGIVAERFVYIGSVGFCIAVGYAIYHYFIAENSKFRSYSKFMNVGVIAVGLVSFVYSFERNKVWDSEISLYQNDMKNLDRSYKAYTMLGQIYYTQGTKLTNVLGPTHPSVVTKIDSSESLLKESLKIYDEYPVTYNNLGVIYYTYRGNIDTAIKFFNRAVELDSVYLEAIYNLANSELWKLKSNLISFRAFSDLVTNGQISSSNVINPNKIVALSQITILSDQLERIRGYSFAIPSQAAQNVANDSIFFLNLRSYTLSMLKNNNLINYFSIEEFDSKMLQNKQEIINSYTKGTLGKHLFNYICTNVMGSYYKLALADQISVKDILDNSHASVENYTHSIPPRMYKCMSIDSSYYPPFKSMQEYFELLEQYNEMVEFNLIAVTNSKFHYHHEFYSNITKGYLALGDKENALKYFKLTLEDIDLNLKDINTYNTNNPQEIANKEHLRPLLEAQRMNILKSIVQIATELNKLEDVQKYSLMI